MNPIRILLIYDVPGWACESECRALAKHLELHAPGRFLVIQAPSFRVPDLRQFDVVFSTLYYFLPPAEHPRSVSQVSGYDYWIRKGWTAEQNTETGIAGWPHLTNWKYMIAKNRDIFQKLTPEDHPRVSLLYHPFDHDFWTPEGPASHRDESVFTVGFAGHRQGLKGLEILEAAVAGLQGVRLLAPTYEAGRIAHDAMPAFYRSLDAYACMSQPGQDAGPRSPAEAGLCGVPVITTRGGQIGEMVENDRTGFLIERDVNALRAAILRLKDDPNLRSRMAGNIRSTFRDHWAMDVGRAWAQYLLGVAADSVRG